MKKVSIKDIQQARENIQSVIRKTDCRFSKSCSDRAGVEVYLKFENQQKTGSYKIRGATNRFSYLSEEEKKRGVIASSAGNHAQGVAYAATQMGIPAKIVMPLNAPIVKVLATKGYGAEVIQHGNIYDEAFDHAKKLAEKNNYIFIPPFEDPHIIAGQGTVAFEVLEQVKDLDAIIVPVGGGGLIAGIAIVAKELNPKIKIYGVQALNVSNLQKSYKDKSIVQDPIARATMADGIAVKNPTPYMLDNYLLPLVDDFFTVTESEMADAMVYLLERNKVVAEASAASSVALAFKMKEKLGKKVCCILTGGNVDLNILTKVIEQGLTKRGRLLQLELHMPDIPGTMSSLTREIASLRANIIEVHHNRLDARLEANETKIEFVLETFSKEHIEEIKAALIKLGARIV